MKDVIPTVEVEWLCGVIRAGDESFTETNASYSFVCTFMKCGDIAYIVGAQGKFSREIYKQIRARFKEMGVNTVRFDKRNTDKQRSFADPVY